MSSAVLGSVAADLAALPQARGVARASIADYEKTHALRLPRALGEFFELAGADYDFLFGGGTRAAFAELDAIRDDAEQTLTECGASLKRAFIPFLSYAGDQFLFVHPDDGDDPPVYRFEVELYDLGDSYIDGWSASGLPQGVWQASPAFSHMLRELVDERRSL